MLAFLPVVCFLLAAHLIHRSRLLRYPDGWTDWRESALAAAVVWGVALVAITEALSLVTLLTREWVIGAWAVFAVGLVALTFTTGIFRSPPKRPTGTEPGPVRTRMDRSSAFLLGGIVSVAGLVGITAILSAPNTPDALNYHMPRVAHWIQNRSLDFYPTTVPWQLSHAPGAEFAILHLQLLSDGDRWANLVQWFAMAGSITGVSLLARDLGADRRTQVIAAAVAATIPMGILQGATAQNDYVATFWLVACVHFLLRLRADRDWQFGLVAGAALGLALLTKSTAYLFALPFLVWYGLSALRSLRLSGWKPVLAISLVALALNAGHYARNYDLYGSPVGPGQEGPPGTTYGKYTNDVFTPTTLASNVVRNLALHTALPGSTVPMVYAIGDLHRQFGADPHDIRTTWTYQLFDVSPTRTDEDIAG
ncbi:MAG: glycosyltransferase family 39 protein, partial [Chloroflexota bacterium]|nr:glycosyltransferase family 39 protein [Chloroflexota bacterium]